MTRSQLAPHPASAFPPLLLDDPPAPLELLLDDAFPPLELLLDDALPRLEALLDPARVPLLEPLLLGAAVSPSGLPPPSSDPTTAPSPPMLFTPPLSPALFGELLQAANTKTAALHTAPNPMAFAIANSLKEPNLWPSHYLVPQMRLQPHAHDDDPIRRLLLICLKNQTRI